LLAGEEARPLHTPPLTALENADEAPLVGALVVVVGTPEGSVLDA